MTFRKLAAALFTLLIALPAAAADEPEVVYGKFHRAIASSNLDEVMKYAPAARRAEMATMSPAQKEAQLKMLSLMLPRAFTVMSKFVPQSGKTARLFVTGPGGLAGQPQTMYGDVRLVNENGEWKVDEVSWSDQRPAGALQPKPAPPPAAAQKPGAPKAAVPQPAEPPVRKLGVAKQPCVYKPVMTGEDLERCK